MGWWFAGIPVGRARSGCPSFACLLALARQGWRESDLAELLPGVAGLLFPDAPPLDWDALQFAAVRHGFRAQLVQRGPELRWDFFHAQAREAVERQHLDNPELLERLHRAVADLLLSLADTDPVRQAEIMFHLIAADDRPRAARYYADAALPCLASRETARTLAERFPVADSAESSRMLGWIVSLLDQPNLSEETLWQLAKRLQFHLGDALENTASRESRRRLFEAVQQTLARLPSADPGSAGWQRDLSVSYHKRAMLAQEQEDTSGSIGNPQSCFTVLHQMKRQGLHFDPEMAQVYHDLAAMFDADSG